MKIQLQSGFYIKIFYLFLLSGFSFLFSDYNIAPYCKIKSFPYCGFSISTITDGIYGLKENETILNLPQFNKMGNSPMNLGAEIFFILPERKKIKKVKIFTNGTVPSYTLSFDNEEEVKIDTLNKNFIEYIPDKEIYCREIKIKAEGGIETVYLGIEEVEIIVEGEKKERNIEFQPLKEKRKYKIEEVNLKEDKIKRCLYVLGPFVYGYPELWAEKIKNLGANTIILYGHYYGNIDELEKGKYTIPDNGEIRRYLERGIKF